ncbi:MAG: DUF5119 domain-containing protein [Prevotella sp.]
MNIANKILAAVVSALCLASCEYKDLDNDDDHVDGIANVQVVVNQDSLDFRPAMNRVVIYPIAHTPMSRTERNVKDSLQIKLWEGMYEAVSYNDDSEINRVTESNDSMQGIFISTERVTSSAFSKDSLLTGYIYNSPDRTAVSGNDTLDVTDEPGNRFVLMQKEVTQLVKLRVKGLKHLEYVQDAAVCIGNCHVKYNVNGDTVTRDKGNVIAAVDSIDTEGEEITFNFNTFGIGKGKQFLSIALQGQNFIHFLHFDATEETIRLSGSRRIEIDINIDADFDIKEIIPKGSGFAVTTDDWETKWEDCYL